MIRKTGDMIKKYFVVTRYRRYIDDAFVLSFLKSHSKIEKFETIKKAKYHMSHYSDTDDSDYGVFSIGPKGKIIRHA
jgi:hypothetical protein